MFKGYDDNVSALISSGNISATNKGAMGNSKSFIKQNETSFS